MEELIIEYLDTNFDLEISTLKSYIHVDKNGSRITNSNFIDEVNSVFGCGKEDGYIVGVIDKWNRDKIMILSNKINNAKYHYFSKHGYDLTTVDDLKYMINLLYSRDNACII